MATWEICYEADGIRYNELVDDPSYGEQLSRPQLEDLATGLQGESDETIDIVWIRHVGGARIERLWPLRSCYSG